jgi:hypothetical protein
MSRVLRDVRRPHECRRLANWRARRAADTRPRRPGLALRAPPQGPKRVLHARMRPHAANPSDARSSPLLHPPAWLLMFCLPLPPALPVLVPPATPMRPQSLRGKPRLHPTAMKRGPVSGRPPPPPATNPPPNTQTPPARPLGIMHKHACFLVFWFFNPTPPTPYKEQESPSHGECLHSSALAFFFFFCE